MSWVGPSVSVLPYSRAACAVAARRTVAAEMLPACQDLPMQATATATAVKAHCNVACIAHAWVYARAGLISVCHTLAETMLLPAQLPASLASTRSRARRHPRGAEGIRGGAPAAGGQMWCQTWLTAEQECFKRLHQMRWELASSMGACAQLLQADAPASLSLTLCGHALCHAPQAEVVQRKSVELFLDFKSAKPGTPVPQVGGLCRNVSCVRSGALMAGRLQAACLPCSAELQVCLPAAAMEGHWQECPLAFPPLPLGLLGFARQQH